jgi:transcriptional regulator with XRE-family HTH domain
LDLATFGQRLRELRKQCGLGLKEVANALDRLAASGPEAAYRNVDASLVGKWERAYQGRRPTRAYVIYLINLFRSHLDYADAVAWAEHAGYRLTPEDVADMFPATLFQPPPLPHPQLTLSRLEPLPTHRLFGTAAAQSKLEGALHHPDDHWLLAIWGIGGIGKTSLANQLVRAVLATNRFYDVAWLNAKQEEFIPRRGIRLIHRPGLQATTFIDRLLEHLDPTLSLARSSQEKLALLTHWLKSRPYLIVIDNLETVADYQALLPTLRRLARPTKFLLTGREQIEDVYTHHLGELSRSTTIAFLRYMGERQDLPALAQAPEPQLNEMYEVVGGNPLALKLIVGQLQSGLRGLTHVLSNLKQAQGKPIAELYTFIYWQAWHDLRETTRRLFILMPQIPNATAEDLARKSKLSEEELAQAIDELTTRSLVEVRGDLEAPYYALHRLTETFLLNEVIRWKSLT